MFQYLLSTIVHDFMGFPFHKKDKFGVLKVGGARASYQTMLPEISTRRSLLSVKVQIPVVTDRH